MRQFSFFSTGQRHRLKLATIWCNGKGSPGRLETRQRSHVEAVMDTMGSDRLWSARTGNARTASRQCLREPVQLHVALRHNIAADVVYSPHRNISAWSPEPRLTDRLIDRPFVFHTGLLQNVKREKSPVTTARLAFVVFFIAYVCVFCHTVLSIVIATCDIANANVGSLPPNARCSLLETCLKKPCFKRYFLNGKTPSDVSAPFRSLSEKKEKTVKSRIWI